MITRVVVCVMVAGGALFPAATAHAHSALKGSDPESGARLDAAPSTMRLEFSEPPISADNLVVKDGCGDDVVASAEVDNGDIVAELAGGQPGKWKVSSRVVSVVDGHETKDGFKFTVQGEADCAAAPKPPERERDEGGGSALPLLLALGGGTALLVVLALVLRRSS